MLNPRLSRVRFFNLVGESLVVSAIGRPMNRFNVFTCKDFGQTSFFSFFIPAVCQVWLLVLWLCRSMAGGKTVFLFPFYRWGKWRHQKKNSVSYLRFCCSKWSSWCLNLVGSSWRSSIAFYRWATWNSKVTHLIVCRSWSQGLLYLGLACFA